MPMRLFPLSLRVQLSLLVTGITVALASALGWLADSASDEITISNAERAVGIAANTRRQLLLKELQQQHERTTRFLQTAPLTCRAGQGPARLDCLRRVVEPFVALEGAAAALLALADGTSIPVGNRPTLLLAASAPPADEIARFAFDEQARPHYVVWTQFEDATLALSFETDRLAPIFLDRFGLGESGEAFLVDPRGFFLTPPRHTAASRQSHPIEAEPARLCLARRDGEMVAPDYRGISVIHGFRSIPEAGGACIMAHIEAVEAFAPAYALRTRVLEASAAFAALAALLSLVAARRLARPLGRLAERARALQAGDFESPVAIEGPAEVRTFARAFAEMADSLSEARGRLVFLSEAGALLASSLDYHATLQSVVALVVPSMADLCTIDLLEADGSIRRLAVGHADPVKADLARRYPPDPDEHAGIAAVIRSGQPVLLSEVEEADLAEVARDAGHLQMLRDLGLRSVMCVPLRARGRTLGAITCLATNSVRRYGQGDLSLLEELGRRAALAIDNAYLYDMAQQAVRAREELLASTSHELRTPLTHVKGFASTLLQTDVEWDEQTRRDFLIEIDREADRLAKLIGDLLDMTRIESGGLDPRERAPASPAALVQEGLNRARVWARDRSVLVDVAEELPPVHVEAARIERVLTNLIENAVKYSPAGSTIHVWAGQVDGALELRVEDEGPGIPPDQLEQVFEKFFRGSESERSGIPGTGLGLAICSGIVQAHGGRIWAENRAEGGARFLVRLPLAGVECVSSHVEAAHTSSDGSLPQTHWPLR